MFTKSHHSPRIYIIYIIYIYGVRQEGAGRATHSRSVGILTLPFQNFPTSKTYQLCNIIGPYHSSMRQVTAKIDFL